MALEDFGILLATIVLFAVVFISMSYVYDQISTEMGNTFGATSKATEMMNSVGSAFSYLDYALIYLYAIFLIGSLILSFFVRTHPIFFPLFFIGALGLTFISYIHGNIIGEFISSFEGFTTIANNYPKTIWFINNLHYLILFASLIIAIVQYSKSDF